MNSQYQRIQFTTEKEQNIHLPFLDVLLTRREHFQITHQMFQQPTHTDRYLNGYSQHHLSQIQQVLMTLIHRSIKLTDRHHLHYTRCNKPSGLCTFYLKIIIEKDTFVEFFHMFLFHHAGSLLLEYSRWRKNLLSYAFKIVLHN